ncbi:MAG: threonine synthase [Rhodothermales bacterium]
MQSPTYESTRGGEQGLLFQQALLAGLARDGGLLSPSHIAQIQKEDWQNNGGLASIASSILGKWLGDSIPRQELDALLDDALNFPLSLVPLKGKGWKNVYVLELFHGPTLSFKDFGARTMARLVSYFNRGASEKLTILVATSGDTGSAVADGFSNQDAVQVVLLYPKGKVSPTQELQLVVERAGVETLAVEGTFDDCQRFVKQAFQDPNLSDCRLSSANSINIGRLLPQMLYYFWAVAHGGFESPVFCVPSGNLGNLTAGVMAHLSGLPVHKFIAAHNRNDYFPRYLKKEDVSFKASVQTPSSSMDVGRPSNFERLRHLLPNGQADEMIWGSSVSDEDTLECMRTVYRDTGYMADPHTAVGIECVKRYQAMHGSEHPCIVLGTAHPSKFPEIVKQAVGIEPDTPRSLAELAVRHKSAIPMPASYEAFSQFLSAKRIG